MYGFEKGNKADIERTSGTQRQSLRFLRGRDLMQKQDRIKAQYFQLHITDKSLVMHTLHSTFFGSVLLKRK